MTDPLHFDSVGRHFFWVFYPLLFTQEQLAACCPDARNVLVLRVFLLSNITRLAWLWKSCVWRSSMKSKVRRTCKPTATLTMVPQISCKPLRLRSPRRFTWRASRSREERSKFGRVGPSRSRRQVILSGNGVTVSRSSHGFLFWSSVCWRFLPHPPHLSAFSLPRVTPWPRSGAVCHVIILRNACIYMRPGLKSVSDSASGPQTRRSSTWISSSFWPLFFSLTFSLKRGVLL